MYLWIVQCKSPDILHAHLEMRFKKNIESMEVSRELISRWTFASTQSTDQPLGLPDFWGKTRWQYNLKARLQNHDGNSLVSKSSMMFLHSPGVPKKSLKFGDAILLHLDPSLG